MQREHGFSFIVLVLLWLGVVVKERSEKSQNVEGTKEETIRGQVGDVAGEKLRQDEGKTGWDLRGEFSAAHREKEMLMSQVHLL